MILSASRYLVGLVCVLALHACAADLSLGTSTHSIACATSADCPKPLLCNLQHQRCVDPQAVVTGVPGVSVTPTTGLTVSELGSSTSFNVVLATRPTANVVVLLASTDETEGKVSPPVLTFTPDNWNVPQSPTVTGQPDCIADGPIAYTILVSPAQSTDTDYAGLDGDDVSVTTLDTLPPAGVTVTPRTGLTTSELGTSTQFSVVLNCQPTADVTSTIATSNAGEGVAVQHDLTFTSSNWATPQAVTVVGQPDCKLDGDVAYTILTGDLVSTDPLYSGVDVPDVSLVNTDVPGARVNISPSSGLVTSEDGLTASFAMVLTCLPTADVTLNLTSSDTSEGKIDKSSVLFTLADWSDPHPVTITGQNDDLADGTVAYTIVTAPLVSTDLAYSGLNPPDVSVSNTDNDMAGVTVSPLSGLVTTEGGISDTFSVVLNAQPSADVVFSVTSSDTTEGLPNKSSLTFTNGDWNVSQTVKVTGVNDNVDDGDVGYTILIGAAQSTDAAFAGIDPPDPAFTNQDDDTAGIAVSPMGYHGIYTKNTGGQSETILVYLTSQPLQNVTVPVASSNGTYGSVDMSTLVFTPTAVLPSVPGTSVWNSPITITVTGGTAAGTHQYAIDVGNSTSVDPLYQNKSASVSAWSVDPTTVKLSTITASSFAANFGSAAAADVNCPSGYKALLVDSARHPGSASWPLHANTIYVLSDGVTILGTTNGSAEFDFSTLAVVNPPGEDAGGTYWTGLDQSWGTANNCSGWTTISAASSGTVGYGRNTDAQMIDLPAFGETCDHTAQLFCFQQ